MRKTWKRKLLFFLTTVCLFAFSTATVACKDDEEETDDGVQVGEQVETMLDLNYRYYELEIYDGVTLYPVLQKEPGEIEWSSADESIAIVSSNGFVEGTGEGETTITATVGDYFATCRVVVANNQLVPELRVDSDTVSVVKNNEFSLNPALYYNGKQVDGVEFSYASSNESVATVTNGNIQGVAYGDAVITVLTNWKHFNQVFTSKSVEVQVVPHLGLRVTNADELTLYTINELANTRYETQKTLEFELSLDGVVQSLSATEITWSVEDTAIVEVIDGELYAVSAGETIVTLEYTTVVDGKSFDLTTSVAVTVERPVMQKSGELLVDTWIDDKAERDKTSISLSAQDVFGESVRITTVLDKESGYEYALENNAFKRGANLITGERTWIIYNERYGVEVSVVVADMVIETFNDLKVFDGVIKQHTYGYYVLNNDINYLGQNFGFSSAAFFGTFDGRGHTISNIRLNKGFFYNVGAQAVVKNFGLIDFVLSSDKEAGAFTSTCLGELNNVYAKGVSYAYGQSGAFAFRFYEGAAIIDSVAEIEYVGANTVTETSGAFAAHIYSMVTIENSFVVTNTYAGENGTNFVGTESIGALELSKAGIYQSTAELKASGKITNTILLNEDLQISVETNELLGYTALSANMPVIWSVDEHASVSFANGVLTTQSETPVSVTVKATSMMDESKTATKTVTVYKAVVTEIDRADVNILEATDNRYTIQISDEITVADVISATLGLDMYKSFTDLRINAADNTLSLPCAVITSGVNTLYLRTANGYYKMSVKLSVPQTETLGIITLQGEVSDGGYTLVLDESLTVADIRWLVSETDLLNRYENLTIDTQANSLKIPASAVLDGQTILYIGTADGYYSIIVKNWLSSTTISTAEELAKALNDRSGNKYYLVNDIDMTGVALEKTLETVSGVNYNRSSFVGSFDGNGYSITGVSFTTHFLYSLHGSFNNVAIYATGNVEETVGKTGYAFFISQIYGGSEMRNVYLHFTMNLDGKSTHVDAVNGRILASQFGVFEDGRETGEVLLENFLFDVHTINESYEVNSTVYKVEKTALFMYRFNNVDVTMRNVYVINDKATHLLYECKSTAKGSLLLQNGNDETLLIQATATNAYGFGSEYTFTNMSRFYRSDYAIAFVGEVWEDIVLFDADSFWAGYTPISTADELVSALSSSARVQCYLTQDIDMSGKSLTGYFGGVLDGDGHKVYGITYSSNSYIREIEGATFRNVAFYATREIPTGTTQYQEFSFIGTLWSATLENVYIELTVDGNDTQIPVYGGVFGHTANSGVTINMTNVVACVKFVDCENITLQEFGLLWRLQRGTVNMTNVYLLGTEQANGVSANAYLIRVFKNLSTDNLSRSYTVKNGVDEQITETNTTSTKLSAPTNLAQGQYCFKDLNAFKQSAYATCLNDEVHFWDGVLGRN